MTQKYSIIEFINKNSITSIAFHTNDIIPNSAFFITEYIKKYVDLAIEKGAKYIISNKKLDNIQKDVEVLVVDDVRESLGIAANFIYKLKPKYIVAVTGTNGKSSIVDYFRQICGNLSLKAASIGTMGIQCTDPNIQKKINEEFSINLTTPDVITMHKILNMLAIEGVDYVALEASSHGIEQKRIGEIKMRAAIFTNFSQDHLDYHLTLDNYKNAKLKLFSDHLTHESFVITSKDLLKDKDIENYFSKIGYNIDSNKLITIGDKGDFEVTKFESNLLGQKFEFIYDGKKYQEECEIIGSFQVTNILMTIAALITCEVSLNDILPQLKKLKPVCGRLEKITSNDHKYQIYVDFAHKPFALQSSLMELKKLSPKRLLVLFGCGGDRDKSKREIMGDIASKIADIVIVTDDNPRTEDALEIRQQIIKGAKNAIEFDSRKEAIKFAVNMLNDGDILLIAGKGHENYQIIGSEKLYFNDAEEARKYI